MVAEKVLIGAFALWIVATMGAQVPGRLQHWIRSVDPLQLVPCWTFFAPRTGTEDFALVYRDWLPENRSTAWRDLISFEPRQVKDAFWHPAKFSTKVFVDLIHELSADSAVVAETKENARVLYLSNAYLAFLHLSAHAERCDPASIGVQFCVLFMSGPRPFRQARLVLLSDVHPL